MMFGRPLAGDAGRNFGRLATNRFIKAGIDGIYGAPLMV